VHQYRLVRAASHDERTLNNRTRGAAEDGATASQQRLQLAVHSCIQVSHLVTARISWSQKCVSVRKMRLRKMRQPELRDFTRGLHSKKAH
jgi:hypothetical protein